MVEGSGDPDHLLKRLRGTVSNSGKVRCKSGVPLEGGKQAHTKYSPQGVRISWDHVYATYERDKFCNGTLRATYVV